MTSNTQDINILINNLINFLHCDILLGKLHNTEISGEFCFDCSLWNEGLIYPYDSSEPEVKIQSIKSTFLRLLSNLECFLNIELSNSSNTLYDYKSQLDRFLNLVLDLKNKVASIQCIDVCEDFTIIALLQSTIIQTILKIIFILENINTILSTFSYSCNCKCINTKIFEVTMGLLINSITNFQSILQDWYSIVMTFFHYSASLSRPYVASYVPKQNIPQPPPPRPISHSCVPCPPQYNSCNNTCPPVHNNCTTYPF